VVVGVITNVGWLLVQNDMMKFFREDLQKRLLSPDFKKQVDGLEILQKALPSVSKEIIEVLDVLLRWFVLQFCKSNTTCLLKVICNESSAIVVHV
jgi:cytoskeleton-associated protein 5